MTDGDAKVTLLQAVVTITAGAYQKLPYINVVRWAAIWQQ
jgi:hypothetical protein